jgi:hypothetical protein
MAGVMILDTFRQQTFAASLSPTRESGAAALCFHARTKTMLAFARSFRCLVGAFHAAVDRTGTVKVTLRLSMSGREAHGAPRQFRRSQFTAFLCHVERSRDISEFSKRLIRDSSTALGMTRSGS